MQINISKINVHAFLFLQSLGKITVFQKWDTVHIFKKARGLEFCG